MKKLLTLLLSLLPLSLAIIALVFGLIPSSEEMALTILFLFLGGIGTIVYYTLHMAKNKDIERYRGAWLISLYLFGAIIPLFYWAKYITQESND